MSPMDSEDLITERVLELVSEHDFRSAVVLLNTLRLRRAESLGDGYGVSDNLCSDIDPTSNTPNAVS